jgi:hypothetical protein
MASRPLGDDDALAPLPESARLQEVVLLQLVLQHHDVDVPQPQEVQLRVRVFRVPT